MNRRPPRSTLFPYPPLFRSQTVHKVVHNVQPRRGAPASPRGAVVRPDVIPAPPREPRQIGEHTSELQSRQYLVCRLLLEKKNTTGLTGLTRYCASTTLHTTM